MAEWSIADLGSLRFVWPWLLLALPLPWLARRLLPPAPPRSGAALRVPFLEEFDQWAAPRPGSRRRWPWGLALLGWLLLVIAAARPEWVGEPLELPLSGRDLLLAMDISGSMEERDFNLQGDLQGQRITRLAATKLVAGDFIQRRQGDRLGLILFGDQAYLQVPLTFDRQTVHTLLDEAAVGLAGKATAIGDAIGLAIKRLRDQKVERRVLILLTDGANNAGEVPPLQAAELAAKHELRIYTIGIGADRMVVDTLLGRQVVNPSADLDEATLKAIAEKTGGRYFRAKDTAELLDIYRLLDELEPAAGEKRLFRPSRPLFPWPLGAAALVALLLLWAAPRFEGAA
jgi:Ca-activated chloride channel homolog